MIGFLVFANGRTIAFGSRKRGASALQTSCTAPSSDHVAAIMGSMYCKIRDARLVDVCAAFLVTLLTLGFGGAAFGLQASFTTLS